MSDPITLEKLTLAGFRAYLKPQEFSLYRDGKPLSLAVFAPNAKGKSSLVDAIEFYFSAEGTLERLGERSAGTKAGRQPLEHVKAQDERIVPEVSAIFRSGKEVFGGARQVVVQSPRPITEAGNRVLGECKVNFIIRGYQLRGFVDNKTPEQRYEDVSRWFGLEPLAAIQKNLRALRRKVKESLDKDQLTSIRLADLKKATSGAVSAWSESDVCQWFVKEFLAPLDPKLTFAELDKTVADYKTLTARKEAEERAVGLDILKQLAAALRAIVVEVDGKQTGCITEFETAISAHATAKAEEDKERGKAALAVFKEVWDKASSVLGNEELSIKSCPVCTTPFEQTPLGSRHAVHVQLKAELEGLSAYRTALDNLRNAVADAENKRARLKTALAKLAVILQAANEDATAKVVGAYETEISAWTLGAAAPDSTAVVSAALATAKSVKERQEAIETAQGDRTFRKALAKADELVLVKENILYAQRVRHEQEKLREALNSSAALISREIARQVQAMLDQLTDGINTLFKKIQGPGAVVPVVRFELPEEDERTQQRLNFVIDFAENRKGVIPSGYFSDSQIHTLALSLRLAAVRLFNIALPVIVLDDVVTSYDADHRKAIASMLADEFADYQIILVTHDERFFSFLKDHLPKARWLFKRITTLDSDYGPRFADHRVPDEVIEAKLRAGEGAANDIRRAEEEWLLDICRGFGAEVRIRGVENAFTYDRSELAMALGTFLKERGLTPPRVLGIANPFIESLQRGDVENFGSHFVDSPSSAPSSGDEVSRWEEFRAFRDLFKCQKCSRRKFHRPPASRLPLCAHDKCGASFAFK